MLVILVVVEVARVLLDARVDAQLAGINLLDSQIIGLEMTVNLSLLLALGILDPDVLDVFATDMVIPLLGGTTGVLLGSREEAGLAHLFREHERNLIPSGASFRGKLLEVFLEILERLHP